MGKTPNNFSESQARGCPSSRTNGNAIVTIDSEIEAPLDPFLMDFGASVSVHEDQIRHVRGGTQEIEERISKINSDLKKEEMVNRQLKQDLAHCETEKKHILQVTCDQLETVQMQRNVLQGLENTLCANLVPAVVSLDRASQVARKAVSYGKDVLPNHQQNFRKISRQIKDDTREIKELYLQTKSCQEKLLASIQRFDAENLDVVLLEKTKEADRMEQELEMEIEKSKATKAAILKKRTEAGANAQELADLVSATVFFIKTCPHPSI
jgi:chromosome segregation ATPase